MKNLIIAFIIIAIFLGGCGVEQQETNLEKEAIQKKEVDKMKLTSSAFENNGAIPAEYTCDGQDVSPALSISQVPENTKSLALIMDDPDAVKPAGKVWNHWIVFNIPAGTTGIPKGEEPKGIHGKGTSGNLKYHGPCPPDAEHRYFFKLYAIDTELDLEEGVSKEDVEEAMKGHIIKKVELIGTYSRS